MDFEVFVVWAPSCGTVVLLVPFWRAYTRADSIESHNNYYSRFVLTSSLSTSFGMSRTW